MLCQTGNIKFIKCLIENTCCRLYNIIKYNKIIQKNNSKEKIMNIMMKKILSLFLAFTIIFSVPPVSAYAAETDSSDFIITSDKIINPMYQQYANQVSSKKSKLLSDAPAVYGVIKNFTDAKKAGVYLRNQLKARNNEISFQFTIPYHSNYEDTLYAALETIINEAVRHTGVPNEGDYINFQWISSEYRIITITFMLSGRFILSIFQLQHRKNRLMPK